MMAPKLNWMSDAIVTITKILFFFFISFLDGVSVNFFWKKNKKTNNNEST